MRQCPCVEHSSHETSDTKRDTARITSQQIKQQESSQACSTCTMSTTRYNVNQEAKCHVRRREAVVVEVAEEQW